LLFLTQHQARELVKVGYLYLLYELFEQVLIPQEVYAELTTGNHPAVKIVSNLSWLEVRQIKNAEQINSFRLSYNLDLGEIAAIILAEELNADQLLIDEKAARRVAKTRRLPIIGTVGILVLAKKRGLIENVQTILDKMIENGTRIGRRLYLQALILAEEEM